MPARLCISVDAGIAEQQYEKCRRIIDHAFLEYTATNNGAEGYPISDTFDQSPQGLGHPTYGLGGSVSDDLTNAFAAMMR
jgi:hypothetical protein